MINGYNIKVRNSPLKRLLLWKNGFPRIVDDIDESLDYRTYSENKDDPVFARAELPKNALHFVDRFGSEYPSSRNIMLSIKEVDGFLEIVQVPGIHDVTSPIDDDPYYHFNDILTQGFMGDRYCNVALFGEDYFERFPDFEYNPPTVSGKKMCSENKDTFGDRYRLVIWTGFTHNYSPYYIENRSLSEGTIQFAPVGSIEPFIVLGAGLDEKKIEEHIEFYLGDMPDSEPKLTFLDYKYRKINHDGVRRR